MSFSYLLLPEGVYVSIHIISLDRLIYLISMITRTILYDVSERTLLLYSLLERLSASFHVMVDCYN